MKLDLLIGEALSYMHVTMLSITTNINEANILIYCKMRNRRRLLFTSKLAIQVELKVLYLEVSGRTSNLLQYSYMMPKTINIGQ